MYHRCEFTLTLPPENNSNDSGKLIDVSPSPIMVKLFLKIIKKHKINYKYNKLI